MYAKSLAELSKSPITVWLDQIALDILATKIGLGFATIPNLTQSFISSVLKAGYSPFFQGTYKMLTDKNYREQIKKYAGASSLELNSMIVGFNPENMSFTAKAAERLTQWSGFQKINLSHTLWRIQSYDMRHRSYEGYALRGIHR